MVGSFSLVEVDEGGCTLYLEVLGVELGFVVELFFEEIVEIVFVEFRFLDFLGSLRLEELELILIELFIFEGVGIFGLGVEEEFILEKLVFERVRSFFFLEDFFNSWVGFFKVILFTEIVFLF